MLVVVRDELTKNWLELTTMNHEQSVKTLPAHGADEPLGERVARGDRTGAPITSMPSAANTSSKLAVNLVSRSRIRNLTGHTRSERTKLRLRACWVTHFPAGFASHVHPSGVELDEEQHVETFEQDGVDGEEIRRKHCCSLGAEELVPAGATSSRRWIDAVTFEYRPDARSSETHARRRQFPVNPSIPRGRILPCQT